MSFWFNHSKGRLATGDLDVESADIRALLCMTNTTADTDRDAQHMSDITTLDEFNGAGYTAATLTGVAVTVDTVNDLARIDCDDFTFGSSVSAGTRSIQGILLKVRVDGTSANDYPLAWIDTGANFPFAADGSEIDFAANASGVLRVI